VGELQPATRRKPLLIGAAVALLILAGGALLGRSLAPSRPAAPQQKASLTPAVVVTPPAAARPPERAAVPDARQAPDQGVVRVKLVLSPPNAILTLDGASRADNPLTLSRSNKRHEIRVEADGHAPRVIRFVAQRDLSFDIKLRARRARPARSPSVEPRAPKASKKKGMKLYDDI
jgi:hypothetical protein